jgi:hypothetical protein
MMIFRLLMLVSLLNGLTANAQFTITGHIKDSSGSNVLYVGINLVNDSNRIVQASVSDSVGAFRFLNVAAGHYILTGTYVGAKIVSQEIMVQSDRAIGLTVTGTTRCVTGSSGQLDKALAGKKDRQDGVQYRKFPGCQRN